METTLKIKIDRPFGTEHPKHGFIYPVNYGYVPNTISGEGEELEAGCHERQAARDDEVQTHDGQQSN